MLAKKRVLLIVGAGIAAYKSLELIRLLRKEGASVVPVLTKAAAEFVTPLSLSALAGEKVYQELFDLTEEAQMGHIQLSRSADLVVVAPATADLMAKMAQGRADDLASTLLLATDTPVMVAPAMNVRMWDHPATQRNVTLLRGDGVTIVGPEVGTMACGEVGPGRLAEPADILDAIRRHFTAGPLQGKHVIVTSGPTQEPIDPVRYISNRSSGAQGTAIAEALLALGAEVSFVTGPSMVPPPAGAKVIRVETACQMSEAVKAVLPADAAVMTAAVADFRVGNLAGQKIKKDGSGIFPALNFVLNPDILAETCRAPNRPKLVVGFAAETENVVDYAHAKRLRKGCDWICANDVSPASGVMGGTLNTVTLISEAGAEVWPTLTKAQTAERLAAKIAEALA